MTDIKKLESDHTEARQAFERACVVEHISRENYEAIRTRYHATMKAYHEALGYGRPVSTSPGRDNE